MKQLRLLGATGLCLAAALTAPASAQTTAQNDSATKAAGKTNGLPLITTRSLEFTTDEASWISLDVSPNGQTIVFDILGDLTRRSLSRRFVARVRRLMENTSRSSRSISSTSVT
jgi:hypothetical protein